MTAGMTEDLDLRIGKRAKVNTGVNGGYLKRMVDTRKGLPEKAALLHMRPDPVPGNSEIPAIQRGCLIQTFEAASLLWREFKRKNFSALLIPELINTNYGFVQHVRHIVTLILRHGFIIIGDPSENEQRTGKHC